MFNGTSFGSLLRTAWDIQNNHKPEHLSPSDLLAILGKKYDQHLDFRQQDAHEFLCQLLDAIRMEESDLIKQRSPPQENPAKRPHHQPATPADDHLLSFVDMLFGGKLASILVCQACKHVSHTYEDYVHEWRRDKLKQFAKRISSALYVAAPLQRSSSVPATPVRDSNPEHNDTQRRRSIDLAGVAPVDLNQDPPLQVPPSPAPDSPSIPLTPTDTPLVLVTDLPPPLLHRELSSNHIVIVAPKKVNGKERRDKDEGWEKISRRISVSVGLKRPKNDRKDKKGTTSSKPADEESPSHHPSSAPAMPDTLNGPASPFSPPERESTSLGLVNEMPTSRT